MPVLIATMSFISKVYRAGSLNVDHNPFSYAGEIRVRGNDKALSDECNTNQNDGCLKFAGKWCGCISYFVWTAAGFMNILNLNFSDPLDIIKSGKKVRKTI